MCRARQLGIQEEIPLRAERPDPDAVSEAAVVLKKKDKLFLVQRPSTGRWGNLWEFPHGTLLPKESHDRAAGRLLLELTNLAGVIGEELLTIKHAVNHHQITLVCFAAHYRKGRFASQFYQKAAWLDPTELAEFPVSASPAQIGAAPRFLKDFAKSWRPVSRDAQRSVPLRVAANQVRRHSTGHHEPRP